MRTHLYSFLFLLATCDCTMQVGDVSKSTKNTLQRCLIDETTNQKNNFLTMEYITLDYMRKPRNG